MAQAPAGWYQQPNGVYQYWDGTQWVSTPYPTQATQVPSVSPATLHPMVPPPPRVMSPKPTTSGSSSRQGRGLAARLSGWSTAVVALVAAAVGVPASMASALLATATATAFVPDSEPATVTKIVDGDTLDVSVKDGTLRIRLLNVDTPESVKPGVGVQCLSLEATAALTELAPVGSRVTLGYDTSRLDQYGRTLAGVTSANGLLVNAELARLGLGLPVVVGNNRKYEQAVTSASLEAQTARVGLFSPMTTCSVAAEVAKVEETAKALESAPAPTTPAEADSLAREAAAAAVLAAALESRLRSDAFEVVTLPASVRKHYRDVALSATSRSNAVQASAKARSAEFVRAAQEAAEAAKAKAEAAAKVKADAAAKARADAEAKAKADAEAAARRQALAAAPPAPRKTTSAPAPTKETSGCVIKGNISSSGERIYHVPGGGSYDVTKIDLSKGERWFCSESDAVAAGWRKARN